MNKKDHVILPLVLSSDMSDDCSDDCSHQPNSKLLNNTLPCDFKSSGLKDYKIKAKKKQTKSLRKPNKGSRHVGCCGICVRKGTYWEI